MTDREKAIVMAYTGISMFATDKLNVFYKYIEEICGKPIWENKLANKVVWDEIKEKSKSDFIELCNETTEAKRGTWEDTTAYCGEFTCSVCKEMCVTNKYKYCPHCGATMSGKE